MSKSKAERAEEDRKAVLTELTNRVGHLVRRLATTQAILAFIADNPPPAVLRFGCPECGFTWEPFDLTGVLDDDVEEGVPYHSIPMTRAVCPGAFKMPKMTARKS